MDRYNLALFLLALAVAPLFFLNGWLSVVACIAIYGLVARLANRDLDRHSGRRGRLHAGVLRQLNGHDAQQSRKQTPR